MTNAEVHTIQVQDTPVLLKRSLAPGIKLLAERVVETTDCAGTGSHSQQRLGHFSHFVGTRSGDKHLSEPFRNVRFIATIAPKRLAVELSLPISRNFDFLYPTSGGHQIARVVVIAVPLA